MKYYFKNLGPIKEAELELGDLTILAGQNNTGKSYLAYAVWYAQRSILEENLTNFIKMEPLISTEKVTLELFKQCVKVEDSAEGSLEKLFMDDSFEDSIVGIKDIDTDLYYAEAAKVINNDEVVLGTRPLNSVDDKYKELFFPDKHYLLTTERSGVFIFEYDVNRSLQQRQHQDTKTEPVKYNLLLVNNLREFSDKICDWYQKNEILESLFQKLFNGKLDYDKKGPKFLPDRNEDNVLRFRHLSSSIRNLAMFYYILKHSIKPGDLIVIDEPESYLNPQKQLVLTRIIAICINKGVKILITTHSDFIIRELDNLLMLHHNFEGKKEFMKKKQYTEEMILSVDKIKPYYTERNNMGNVELIKADIGDMGIDIIPIDVAIDEQNNTYNTLVDTLLDLNYESE